MLIRAERTELTLSSREPINRAEPGQELETNTGVAGRSYRETCPGIAKQSVIPLPEALLAERRQRQGIRLPPGHRFFLDELRESYARLIDWTMGLEKDSLFATFTFKDFICDYKANFRLDKYLGRMTEALKDAGGSRLKYAVATEWQTRQVIHFHAVLVGNGLGLLSRKRQEYRWQHGLSGGFARLYNAERGAAPYLAKYLNKSQGAGIRWGGDWRGIHTPKSLGARLNSPELVTSSAHTFNES